MNTKLEQFLHHVKIKTPTGELREFSDAAKDFARAIDVAKSEGRELIFYHPRRKYPPANLPYMKTALAKYWKNLSGEPTAQECDATNP